MIDYSDEDKTLVIGNPLSEISVLTGVVGNVLGVAQLSGSATSSRLSDKRVYPYYSRISSPSFSQTFAFRDLLLYYEEVQGLGWTDVAIISTTDEYGVNLATNFIETAEDDIDILTYQQFLPGASNINVELEEVKNSGARVILAFLFTGWETLVVEADKKGLVGEQYVWIVPDTIVGIPFTNDSNSDAAKLSRGLIGDFIFVPEPTTNPLGQAFLAQWYSVDPTEYYGAGITPTPFAFLAYDTMTTTALAIADLDSRGMFDGRRIPPEEWTNTIRNISFEGISGSVSIDEKGDRIASFYILNYIPENNTFVPVGVWSPFDGYTPVQDIIWFDNTTNIPDLDIREPFNYWSCDDKEMRRDSTGKEISLHTPDSNDVDEIESHYHCDHFIDCHNMSDESVDCAQNFVVLFIVFGIITGILILITLALLIFTIIFGIFLKYRRLRVASPVFLVITLLSVLIGYISIYAWFGKPHPVACAFQPWLLGLPAISMIAALCVKAFRIWRIFRFPLKKTTITNLELLVLWVIVMIPAILIVTIWTIVSTPTASMEDRDGDDHYVCNTGGFTGEPGGLVFFFILVGYGAIVLLLGVFLSIVTRKVPSQFNESKLIAISIYNLGFLSVVIIPVFMVIQPFNPFVAWILRTLAILYAFTATLVLQFAPKIIGIIFIDKFRNVQNLSTKSTSPSSFSGKSSEFLS